MVTHCFLCRVLTLFTFFGQFLVYVSPSIQMAQIMAAGMRKIPTARARTEASLTTRGSWRDHTLALKADLAIILQLHQLMENPHWASLTFTVSLW